MQQVPIGTAETVALLETEATKGVMMEARAESAGMAVCPNVPCHAADIGATTEAFRANAAADTANMRAAANSSDVDTATSDMGAGAEAAKMSSAAKPSHMAATAARLRCSGK
ncbi:hypothetical protein OZ411_25000 [Bradyrhizobium sp. Arg237L]|uniref:hypothetical protein n=1 Tax=Bradyrhizobium sp. Arg237L TaxID=3003352 RepID=UPI00249E3E0F|nr:hypothetical protein [Bradyrhizobium sp. Arg237L]MDI4236074.1 hypothetical protein [Bradyrhizobium sp. Arg237L]